jgi:hypothetical protein
MAAIQAGDQKEMNRYTAESRKAAMIHQAATGESALEWLRQNGSLKNGQKPASPDGHEPHGHPGID